MSHTKGGMARTSGSGVETGSAADFLPERLSLTALRESAAGCRGCHLWQVGTQTVFGQGAAHAEVMFIGEQPGDYEDRAGKPFVGPAGKLLDEALSEAGIDRATTYVTNAVKHFKWQLRGKRRLHKTPAQREIDACHQWLEGEIAAVKPHVIVCLGSTAAKAVISKDFKVSLQRGQFVESPHAPFVFATLHPSALLRVQEDEERELAFRQFVRDLSLIKKALAKR